MGSECPAVSVASGRLAAGWRYASQGGSELPAYETRPGGFGVMERTISATGSVKALVTVDVGSQLSGLISEMKADFNDPVKEGGLLAVIDRAPFEAKLASAAANLAMARADIGMREAAVARARTRVGLIFRYLPARWAAALNPIDALRRE